MEKLRDSYESKLDRAREKVRKAEQKVENQEDQYESVRTSTWARVGSLVAGLLGRKRTRSEIRSAASAASRARKEKSDIRRAESDLDQVEREYRELEKDLEREIESIRKEFDERVEELTEITVAPRKSDIEFEVYALLWAPYRVSPSGQQSAAF
jgi:DNA repair exonuclease SbcCD ATPase subunit